MTANAGAYPSVLVVGRRRARRLTAAGRAMEGFTAGADITSLQTSVG
jgi:hypothetical protein